jgi:integrase
MTHHTLAKFVAMVKKTGSTWVISAKNLTNWFTPTCSCLGLAKRRPYQMRHTAATHWLARGESRGIETSA